MTADEPTEADPYPDGLPEDLYVDIESTIHQHCGHDGQSDEANDWVTDLMSALTPLIVRALVGGTEADPLWTNPLGQYEYGCEQGHHVQSGKPNLDACPVPVPGGACGAEIWTRTIPYHPLRALVGGRSAAPTRDELAANVAEILADYGDDLTDADDRVEAINRVVALLSLSAAEPPEDPATIAAAAAVKATAGHVYAAGYEQSIADADERMPTICLSCMQPIPFAEYVEHRSGCQDDIAESNARLSLCGCGHTAEAHTADGGACTTWRPAHERWCGCRAFVARGVAAEPNKEHGDGR